jgi:NADH-quinone oxidoreductase subunit M
VAHLGFCILGLVALNNIGVRGSVLYMINHGLSTGGLFLMIGMIYERYHTRDMRELGGLAAKMPVWATFMVFFAMASVGLPGLNGFVSEFMCLLAAFQADPAWTSGTSTVSGAMVPGASVGGQLGPTYAFIAGIGMVVAAMYLLMMVGKVVWGPLKEPHHGDAHGGHEAGPLPTDLSLREVLVLLPMAAGCIWLGVYPNPALEAINPSSSALVSQMNAAAKRYAENHPERLGNPAVRPVAAPKAPSGAQMRQAPAEQPEDKPAESHAPKEAVR